MYRGFISYCRTPSAAPLTSTYLFQPCIRERIRSVALCRAALAVGHGRHVVDKLRAVHEVGACDVVLRVRLAVEGELAHVAVGIVIAVGLYRDILAVLKVQSHLVEVRRAENIFARTRAYGIEAHCREYVPGRCLAVVLVAAIAVGVGVVHTVHGLANPVLRLPRLA